MNTIDETTEAESSSTSSHDHTPAPPPTVTRLVQTPVLVTCSDILRAAQEGLKTDPDRWTLCCTLEVEWGTGSSQEYDFEEPIKEAVWEQCIKRVLLSPPTVDPFQGKLYTFELRPPAGCTVLIPTRKPHTLRLRLQSPCPSAEIKEFVSKYGTYKWDPTHRMDAFDRPGWKDYYAHSRMTMMTSDQMHLARQYAKAQVAPQVAEGIVVTPDGKYVDPLAQSEVVDQIVHAERPHLSVMAKRYLDQEQLKTIGKSKPGAPAPTFLKLQPEFVEVEKIVMAVDPILFGQQVIQSTVQELTVRTLGHS